MSGETNPFEFCTEVVIAGGAFAGEKATVVAREGDLVTVDLSHFGELTRMVFDVSALAIPSSDPRALYRIDLERHYQRCAREDMIGWFAQRDPSEELLDTDELACLYQIASPIRREYLRVVDEFDATFTDAASASRLLQSLWDRHRDDWFRRLTPPPIDEVARARALALMDRVREAVS